MVEAPSNARLLSETEIGDSWIDARKFWVQAIYWIALSMIPCLVLAIFSIIEWNMAILVCVIFGMGLVLHTTTKINTTKNELNVIAISDGHPWHDSDGTGKTTVHILSEPNEWVQLKPNARIVSTTDPILDRSILRDGDPEGEVLARWSGQANPRIVAIINMAQALANAQDRGEDDVDEFEVARERETTGESLLDREWMDTDEGSIDYEPGAILRAFQRANDDE